MPHTYIRASPSAGPTGMVRAEEESCSLSRLGTSCDGGMLGISTGAHEYMATKLLPPNLPPGINTGISEGASQNSGAR